MTDFLGAMLRLGMITPVVHGEIVAMFQRTKAETLILRFLDLV